MLTHGSRTVERLGGKPKMIRTEVASSARIYLNQMVTLFLGRIRGSLCI